MFLKRILAKFGKNALSNNKGSLSSEQYVLESVKKSSLLVVRSNSDRVVLLVEDSVALSDIAAVLTKVNGYISAVQLSAYKEGHFEITLLLQETSKPFFAGEHLKRLTKLASLFDKQSNLVKGTGSFADTEAKFRYYTKGTWYSPDKAYQLHIAVDNEKLVPVHAFDISRRDASGAYHNLLNCFFLRHMGKQSN